MTSAVDIMLGSGEILLGDNYFLMSSSLHRRSCDEEKVKVTLLSGFLHIVLYFYDNYTVICLIA